MTCDENRIARFSASSGAPSNIDVELFYNQKSSRVMFSPGAEVNFMFECKSGYRSEIVNLEVSNPWIPSLAGFPGDNRLLGIKVFLKGLEKDF